MPQVAGGASRRSGSVSASVAGKAGGKSAPPLAQIREDRMKKLFSGAAMVGLVLALAACHHDRDRDNASVGASSASSAPAYSGSSANPQGRPSASGSYTNSPTQTDVRGATTPSPGMDTRNGGSTTQSLGVPPPGAPHSGQ
jgi:hypothetical protein